MGETQKQSGLNLEQGFAVTQETKASIYDKYLSNLKGDITSLIFVDASLATELMQSYNKLLETFDASSTLSIDMMGELNKLEQRVEEEKSVKQTNSSISAFENKCIELTEGLNLSTIGQTEEGWRNLKNLFESAKGTCTLEQISQVQNFLSNLHFHIIKAKMVESQERIELRDEIEEAEQAEMKSTMYYHAARLVGSTDARKKEFGEKIKTSMQLYSQAMQEYEKEHFTFFTKEDERAKKAQSERQEFLESVKVNQKALGGQGTNLQQGEIKVDKEEKNGQMEVGE